MVFLQGAAVAQRVEQVDLWLEGSLTPGRAELHVKISLSKILNPTLFISEGPAMRLVQGVPCPRPETRLGLAPAATPRMERDKWLRTMTWHGLLTQMNKMAPWMLVTPPLELRKLTWQTQLPKWVIIFRTMMFHLFYSLLNNTNVGICQISW